MISDTVPAVWRGEPAEVKRPVIKANGKKGAEVLRKNSADRLESKFAGGLEEAKGNRRGTEADSEEPADFMSGNSIDIGTNNIYNKLGHIITGDKVKNDSVFVWTLKGEPIKLKKVRTEKIKYIKRSNEDLQMMRRRFNSRCRRQFLKKLSEKSADLNACGINEIGIHRIQNGLVPRGWQVHHKLPLDDSGTNDYSNLVLIKNHPYHKVITNYQRAVTKGFRAGSFNAVNWPIIDGDIYPFKN